MLLLDTSILIELELQNEDVKVKLNSLLQEYPGAPAISSISSMEFLFGSMTASVKKLPHAIDFLNDYDCLPFTKMTSITCAKLRKELEKKGLMLSMADLLIASTAKEYGATLVTLDSDFLKVNEIEVAVI